MNKHIILHKQAPGAWQVVTKWGTVTWESLGKAVRYTAELSRVCEEAEERRAEYVATAQGRCLYYQCSEVGHQVGAHPEFRFCPEHSAPAVQVLDRPAYIRGRAFPKNSGYESERARRSA